MTHSYRQLNVPELLSFFVKITKGRIVKPRDARALTFFMDTHGASPVRLLARMITLEGMSYTQDIPSFIRSAEYWPVEDELTDGVVVASYLTGQDFPQQYFTYQDLIDEDIEDAVMQAALDSARTELEQWIGNALDKPASLSSRGRSAQQSQQRRQAGPP